MNQFNISVAVNAAEINNLLYKGFSNDCLSIPHKWEQIDKQTAKPLKYQICKPTFTRTFVVH